MSKPHSSKIYIRHKEKILDFLWANVCSDGSVIIGFSEPGAEEILFVVDEKLGELRPRDFKVCRAPGNSKVTFHPSGIYKLTTYIGLTHESMDRCTIIGTPFKQITKPTRMVEVLLSKRLHITEKKLSKRDIILDTSEFPQKPLCCTISCMPADKYHETMKFVNTSECEYTNALEHGGLVWSFTLRVSRNVNYADNQHTFFIYGKIRWGQKEK
ncbi:MAG: hypothetical protein ABIK53_04830 [bacterium]